MTVREYIGARYIPLFMGEWDNTKAYEPLSVVSYQGNSYTSRQAVPIGIEITNTTYWYVSGNYNAQVEQYRQEVRDIANIIPATDFDSTHTVKDAIDAIKDIIPATDFDSTHTVKDAIDNLKNRNVICVGDSWNAGYYVDQTTGQTQQNPIYGWGNIIESTNVFNRVINNGDYGSIGSGNTGFACNAATGRTFYHWLSNIATNLSDIEKESITDIIILGGVNDAANNNVTESDISNYINLLIETAKTNFPNSKMYIFPMQNPGQAPYIVRRALVKKWIINSFNTHALSNGYMVNICEPFSRWFIGNATYIPGGNWRTDDAHATPTTMQKCASLIIQHIAGGDTAPYIVIDDANRYTHVALQDIVFERCEVIDNTLHWCGTYHLNRETMPTETSVQLANANPIVIDTLANETHYQGNGVVYGLPVQTYISSNGYKTTSIFVYIPTSIASGSYFDFNISAPWYY